MEQTLRDIAQQIRTIEREIKSIQRELLTIKPPEPVSRRNQANQAAAIVKSLKDIPPLDELTNEQKIHQMKEKIGSLERQKEKFVESYRSINNNNDYIKSAEEQIEDFLIPFFQEIGRINRRDRKILARYYEQECEQVIVNAGKIVGRDAIVESIIVSIFSNIFH